MKEIFPDVVCKPERNHVHHDKPEKEITCNKPCSIRIFRRQNKNDWNAGCNEQQHLKKRPQNNGWLPDSWIFRMLHQARGIQG